MLKFVGVMCLLTAFGNLVTGRADNIPVAILCGVAGAFIFIRGMAK